MSTSARGFLYTGHRAFIDTTTPANRVFWLDPLRVPTPLRAESPMYSGVRPSDTAGLTARVRVPVRVPPRCRLPARPGAASRQLQVASL